jgi:hypothetical protein
MTWKARRRPSFRCSMARSSAKRWSAREAGPGEGCDAGRARGLQPRLDKPSELLSPAKLLADILRPRRRTRQPTRTPYRQQCARRRE